MVPEEYSYKQPQQPSDKTRKLLFAGIIGLLLVIVLVIVISSAFRAVTSSTDNANVPDPNYRLAKTDLVSTQNFSALQGNDLYSYNGLAFYKTALDGNKLTVLRSGIDLPAINSLSWIGSSGAVLTFNQSFLGTKVYDILQANRTPIDEASQGYVWYLDFASGNLSIVSTLPLEGTAVAYDAAANGFYYVTGPSYRTPSTRRPLNFYSLKTATSTQITADLGVTDITAMSTCSASPKVCLVGRDSATPTVTKLYSIDANGGKTVVTQVTGRIFATNNPDLYISSGLVNKGNGTQTSATKTTEDTDYAPDIAKLYNAKTKASTDLGFTISQDVPYASFLPDGSFYSFDNDYNLGDLNSTDAKDRKPAYRAGVIGHDNTAPAKSKLFQLLYRADSKPFSGGLSGASYGSGASLLADANNAQYVFSNTQSNLNLTGQPQDSVANDVKACLAAGQASQSTYLNDTRTFQVSFAYDAAFANHIAAFSSCLVQKGESALVGYNYDFAGNDPVNGRLVTD